MTKRMFLTSFAVLALLATATMVMAQPPGGGQRGQGGQGGQRGQGGQGAGFQGGAGGGFQPGGPGGMMGGGGAMGILANEEARTALGVTEDQMQKLRDANQALFANMPRPQQGQAPDPAQMAQMREQMQKIQAESRKNLESILSADQVTKLDVMVFQRSGGLNPPTPPAGAPGGAPGGGPGAGFMGGNQINVETLRALNLTDDQKKKVEEAQAKMMEAIRPPQGFDFRNATQEERQAQFERMREASQKANADFLAAVKGILTDAQKAKAEELMKDVPTFLQRRAPGAGAPGNRGNLGNFRPGEGVTGQNPNREQAPQRNNAGARGRAFQN